MFFIWKCSSNSYSISKSRRKAQNTTLTVCLFLHTCIWNSSDIWIGFDFLRNEDGTRGNTCSISVPADDRIAWQMTELEPGGYQTHGRSCHRLLAVSACKGLQKLEFSRDSLNSSLFFLLLLLLLLPQSALSAWLFCIATSCSCPFWVKLGRCEYLPILCLEYIWIFNHYYHPLSS